MGHAQTADYRVIGEGSALTCPAHLAHLAVAAALFISAFLVSALPARAQLLVVVGEHELHLPDYGDYQQYESLIGDVDAVLKVLAFGQLHLTDESPDFLGKIYLRGALLVLRNDARLQNATHFKIENGGRLMLNGFIGATSIGKSPPSPNPRPTARFSV